MKYSMSDASGSAINENISNWLSVSVSPPLKMDSSTTLAPNSSSFYLSPYSCYGDSISFFSPLTVMPLKSDGSLCILEALSTTDSQGVAQEYGSSICGRETMAMNSLYPDQARWLYPETISCQPNSMYQISPSPQYTSLDSHHNQHQQRQMSSTAVDDGGDVQSLRLAMSPGSQSSCVTGTNKSLNVETKKRGSSKVAQKQQPLHRKSLDTFGKRTSQFRGVTRHRWTGRYEAHLWDNSCKKEGQTRKGRQVYLGGYDMEEKAARAYDLAALKYWGSSTHINFPLENYYHELEDMKPMTRQEFVAHLRRKSSGFSRGASIYRGVTRHHQNGRWQARIGRVAGNKDLYLGTFSTQEEAAEAYDVAAIKFRGLNAVTNFNVSRYDVETIVSSTTLLAGELAKRSKTTPTLTTEGLLIPNHQLTQPANNDHQKTSCASPLEALNESVGNPNN